MTAPTDLVERLEGASVQRIRGDFVLGVVADFYGISPAQLKARKNEPRYARPRQIGYLVVRKVCPHLSSPAIGRLFGRDHTTILTGIRQAESRIAARPEVGEAVGEIIARIVPFSAWRRSLDRRIVEAEQHLSDLRALAESACDGDAAATLRASEQSK